MPAETVAWKDATGWHWPEIMLDQYRLPVASGLGYANLGAFERKFVIGDPQRDDDPLLSVWAQTDWTGGGQIDTLRVGTDVGRFRRGDLHARSPYQLSLNRLVVEHTFSGVTADVWPLGDLNNVFYLAADRNIYSYNETTDAVVDTTHDLGFQPVNIGVEFAATEGGTPELWVPFGANGYARYTVAGSPTTATSAKPIAFAEFDDQLWALCTDGQLLVWDMVSAWTPMGRLNSRHTPRGLVVYYDRADEPALHAITNRGVWAFGTNNRFYQGTTPNAPHPDHGLGADIWQIGGSLHYTAGMQVFRYEIGATVSPMGLDRDAGVPIEHRGRIVDLRGGMNELYALVRGQTSAGATQNAIADSPPPGGSTRGFTPGQSVNSVYAFTGQGWHEVWANPAPSGEPTRLYVSAAGGAYRIWWGSGGSAYTVDLPTDMHNPRQGLEGGVDRFQPSGYLQTGLFNAGMDGFTKIASHVTARVTAASGTELVDLWYRVGRDGAWTLLGTIDAPGKRSFGFGRRASDGFYEGVSFEEIEFEYRFRRGSDTSKTPLVDSFVFHFLKVPHASASWTASIPIAFEDVWMTTDGQRLNAAQVKAALDDLLAKPGFVKLTIGTRSYRVRIAQVTGSDAAGLDARGERQLSIVEVPVAPDEPEAA